MKPHRKWGVGWAGPVGTVSDKGSLRIFCGKV